MNKSISILFQLLFLNAILINQSTCESLCSDFNPCKNMADCLRSDDDSTRVRCVCKRGFNGNLCEIWPKICSVDFCFNGGTCVLIKRIPRCLCQPEFNGLFCEKNVYHQNNQNIQINYFESNLNSTKPELAQAIRPEITSSTSVPITTVSTTSTSTTTTTQEPLTIQPTEIYAQNNFFNYPNQFYQQNPFNQVYNPMDTTQEGAYQQVLYQPYPSYQYDPNAELNKIKNSICDFEPCLNFGNCIETKNSLFKFRCVCPENYGGILCENYIPKDQVFENFNNEREPLIFNNNNVNYQATSYWYNEASLATNPTTSEVTTKESTTTESTTQSTSTSTTTTSTTSTTSTTTTQSTTTQTTSTTTSTLSTSTTTTTTTTTTQLITETRNFQYTNQVFPTTEKKNRKYSICAQLRPCANNGQCVDNDLLGEGFQKFKCICKPEYTGVFCHIKVNRRANVCAYNLCLNSGECIPSRDNTAFTCVCPPNFTGKFCEINFY